MARGPLVYSLKLDERRVNSPATPPAQKAVLHGHDVREFPALVLSRERVAIRH